MAKGVYKHSKGEKSSHYKHGLINTRLYRIWANIKTRCYNSKATRYEDWGARGITVCDEWRNDFEAFYDWAMNNGYSDELTIDRIDNNGNYEPSNCRWVDRKTQSRNTRRNKYITFNGEMLTISEWSERTGINHRTIGERLKKGYSAEKVLSPVKKRGVKNTTA